MSGMIKFGLRRLEWETGPRRDTKLIPKEIHQYKEIKVGGISIPTIVTTSSFRRYEEATEIPPSYTWGTNATPDETSSLLP